MYVHINCTAKVTIPLAQENPKYQSLCLQAGKKGSSVEGFTMSLSKTKTLS